MALINTKTCAACGCQMAIPKELYEAALCSEKIHFFCAYGHPQRFKPPKTPPKKKPEPKYEDMRDPPKDGSDNVVEFKR